MGENGSVEELKKYINTLQSDVTKLQIKLFKSEETVKKLQELNTLYCKVALSVIDIGKEQYIKCFFTPFRIQTVMGRNGK